MKAHDYQPNPFAPGWERCTGCGLVSSPGSPADSRGGDCHEVQIAKLTEDNKRLLERLRSCTCEGPQVRHIVERDQETGGAARDVALCGEPWDRFGVSAGPLCDGCRDEYRKRHPTWPLPGGAE